MGWGVNGGRSKLWPRAVRALALLAPAALFALCLLSWQGQRAKLQELVRLQRQVSSAEADSVARSEGLQRQLQALESWAGRPDPERYEPVRWLSALRQASAGALALQARVETESLQLLGVHGGEQLVSVPLVFSASVDGELREQPLARLLAALGPHTEVERCQLSRLSQGGYHLRCRCHKIALREASDA